MFNCTVQWLSLFQGGNINYTTTHTYISCIHLVGSTNQYLLSFLSIYSLLPFLHYYPGYKQLFMIIENATLENTRP